MAKLDIHQFPCLSDNYGVLIHDAEAERHGLHRCARRQGQVAAALKEKGWRLTHILTTHHHGDHTDGNLALKAETKCTIIGPRGEAAKVPGIDKQVGEGDTFTFGSLRGARARHARPYRRPYHLLDPVGGRGVRRRHAVCDRLRPRHRGQRPDDVGLAPEADGAAQGDARLLRTRVHAGQCEVRAHHRAGERGAAEARQGGRRSCAPPASRRCRPTSASSSRPTRSCARTCRRSSSGSAWRASPSGRSSARSASARTGAEARRPRARWRQSAWPRPAPCRPTSPSTIS